MSTLSEMLIRERQEYGPVRLTDKFLAVYGFSYQLVVLRDACTYMPINDFKKMVKVIKGVLDPDDYYDYLSAWENVIEDKRFAINENCVKEDRKMRKDECILMCRLAKLERFLNKQITDLPEWAINED